VLALGLLSCVAAGVVAGPDEVRQARLEQDNTRMRRQIELASEKSAYLVLDLAGERLRLMAGAAVLRDFPILDAEIGVPTLFFVATGDSTGQWRDSVRSGAHLEPRRRVGRIEMVPAGTPDEPAVIPVPAEPEEALPAPDRFVLRYADGFTIEVRAAATSRPGGFWSRIASGLRARLVDAAAVASGARSPRVRVVLSATDAGALYRSFPTESKLLVL
jgi:hypothetical protein